MLLRPKRFEMLAGRGKGGGAGSSSSSGSGRKLNRKLCSSISLLFVMGLGFVSACPSDCVCKWKGGKQTVECVNRGLRTFPHNIDPGTQVLDISGNKFETLPPDHFMRSGLINLQKIYLSRCQLSHINSRAFRGLSNLVDLDLSHNVLGEVPSPSFPDCQGLMKLILSGNPIRTLPKKAFIALQSLTTLEMSHCEIERIEKGAFEGLLSLEWLKLNGNRLKRISGLASLPVALKGVYLEENPWECDCRLLELRVWLTERNVANSVEPRCSGPDRLANFTLKDVSEENFACVPELSPTTMYQKIGEGKNVSLLCKVSSIPESTVEWWFNGQPVSNSSLNMVVDTSSGTSVASMMGNSPYINMFQGSGGNGNGYGGSTSSNSNSNNNLRSGGPVAGSMSSSSSSSSSFSSSSMNPSLGMIMSGVGSSNTIEKKSELLILNATAEENGTFVCVARNPAGVSMANFTLRVLTKYESELPTDLGSIPSFVSNYPNLMIIIISTLAVIVLVILLVCFFFLLCKCSRLCGFGKRRRSHSAGPSGASSGRRAKGDGDNNTSANGKGKGGKGGKGHKSLDGKDGTMNSVVSGLGGVCGGKLDRHLSETSTLTTHTKSNGSVFLLSTSSELGLGDSNPDLIEGVKRVEGDGLETSFSHAHFNNGTVYCSTSNVNGAVEQGVMVAEQGQLPTSSSALGYLQQPPPHYATLGHCLSAPSTVSPSAIVLEPPQFPGAFPADYGLPKGLSVATLVRRSPSFPSSNPAPSSNSNSTLPSNYDLAKYPKEYINPQQSAQSAYATYGPVPQQVVFPHGAPPHNSQEFYPAYILPPGAYVTTFSSPGGEEYTVAMGGHYIDATGLPPPPVPINCSCAPILEGNENEEKPDGPLSISPSRTSYSTSNQMTSVPTQTGSSPLSPEPPHSKSQVENKNNSHHPETAAATTSTVATNTTDQSTATSTSSTTTSTTPSSGNKNGKQGTGNANSSKPVVAVSNARLQRQLTTQVNESPDEGYEDESAEGTEI